MKNNLQAVPHVEAYSQRSCDESMCLANGKQGCYKCMEIYKVLESENTGTDLVWS